MFEAMQRLAPGGDVEAQRLGDFDPLGRQSFEGADHVMEAEAGVALLAKG